MPRIQKLDPLRRFLEGMTALREALEEADRAEAFLTTQEKTLTEAKKRAADAERQAADLEGRRAALAQEIEAERKKLFAPVLEERARLLTESEKIKAQIARDRQAMDEERGRRLSTLQQMNDRERDARIQNEQTLKTLREDLARESYALKAEIDRLKATAEETRKDTVRARSDYRAVLDAAAKLAGR